MIQAHPELGPLLDPALPEAQRQELLAHVAGCARCTLHYDRLLVAQRALGGEAVEVLGAAEHELVLAQVLAQVTPAPRAQRGWAWLGLPAAVAVAAGVILLVQPRQGTFVERSAGGAAAVGVKAFCSAGAEIHHLERQPRCAASGVLVLAVRNASGKRLDLHAWLEDGAGQVLRLERVGVAPGPEVQVLEPTLDLAGRVAAGPAELKVVLCEGCDFAAAWRLAESAPEGGAGLPLLHRQRLSIEEARP